jgi:putative PIN family toxin of toxin-antitoxin system
VRIILDTNVVMSALLWRGTPHQLLARLRQREEVQLYSSAALLEELADVLTRPSATKRLALNNQQAHTVLLDYVAALEIMDAPPLPQPVCRDPDDDAVLALALAAAADLVVSGDQDLLVLRAFQGIPVCSVADALRVIEAG